MVLQRKNGIKATLDSDWCAVVRNDDGGKYGCLRQRYSRVEVKSTIHTRKIDYTIGRRVIC